MHEHLVLDQSCLTIVKRSIQNADITNSAINKICDDQTRCMGQIHIKLTHYISWGNQKVKKG